MGQTWDLNAPVSQWQGIRVENNRVTGMEFRGLFSSGVIPASFGNLTALTSIYFLDCRLSGPLPESFGNLVNLTYLKLSAAFYDPVAFPAFLNNLTKLTTLDLSVNNFTDTNPITLDALVLLENLDLSYTKTGGKIPLGLENLNQLHTLVLNSSQLSGAIPTSINTFPNLINVDLSDNAFNFGDLQPFIESYNSQHANYSLTYSPQAKITLSKTNDTLVVFAGGDPANNTYRWYKTGTGELYSVTGNGMYIAKTSGEYYAEVVSSKVRDLTLSSEPINIKIQLQNGAATVEQNISGSDTTYINNGIFKLAALKPIAGGNSLQGKVSTTVNVEPSVIVLNSQPYVQRHFDILPEINANTAQAIVVLYFTAQEFLNYNQYVTQNNLNLPLLPEGTSDNGNVRIIQYHGTFSGSSNPGNYANQNYIIIKPYVTWDAANQWWVVTFPVNGFSGFFLNTIHTVVPLTLLEFKGKSEGRNILLSWTTAEEINTKTFIIEHTTGSTFTEIGSMPAISLKGKNSYQFTHSNPVEEVNFYRLKMVDADGRYTYSKVISCNSGQKHLGYKIYPNPSSSVINIEFNSEEEKSVILKITDAAGATKYKTNFQTNKGNNSIPISITNFPAGLYYIHIFKNGHMNSARFIKN